MKNWYIRNNAMRLGPFSFEDLRNLDIYSDDYIWNDGIGKWTKASSITELKEVLIPVEECNFTLKVNTQRMFPVSYSLKRPTPRISFGNPASMLFNAFAKGRALVLNLSKPALRPALGK
jgi:hypothetical protein